METIARAIGQGSPIILLSGNYFAEKTEFPFDRQRRKLYTMDVS
jgi:hypothetical protein